jgi:spore germination cell wall hydrolase CwlJ-like protein
MKRYQAIFIAVLISTVVYYEHSFHGKVDQINETVSETNMIVKQIKITLLNTPYNMDNDYHCLASNIYWESRNQSLGGKMAVAQVVMNRVDNERFPDTICGVVKQTKYYPSGGIDLHDCQFSWYCDGLADDPLQNEKHIYEDVFYLAVNMIEQDSMDITEGATHYHSDKVHPYWADSLQRMTKIDNHIFYKRK